MLFNGNGTIKISIFECFFFFRVPNGTCCIDRSLLTEVVQQTGEGRAWAFV